MRAYSSARRMSAGVHDRPAVVGDGDDAGARASRRSRRAARPASPTETRADRVDARQRRRRAARSRMNRVTARAVVHRIGVRHAGDGREAAGDRRRGAGRDRLLVLVARARAGARACRPGRAATQQPRASMRSAPPPTIAARRADARRCGRPRCSTSRGASTVRATGSTTRAARDAAVASLMPAPPPPLARRLGVAGVGVRGVLGLAARDQQVEHAPCAPRRRWSPGP